MHMEATPKVVNQLQGKRPDYLRLPSGFRFHPTDDELVRFYLTGKVLNGAGFAAQAIAEVQDLNKYEPWDLPEKANIGDQKEWYFFTLRDRKYPTGMRTNRATMAGYWKATGKDKDVISSLTCCLVGMKKTLVFYKGRAPKGEKTNWIMHEYRLEGNAATLSFVKTDPKEWVVCRIFEKKSGKRKRAILQTDKDVSYSDSHQPPVCSEVHQTATENADTKIEVGRHNDQVSCITRIQLEDMQEKGVYCSSTGNAWNNNGRSSFVAPVDSAIEIGAITGNSVYTDTLVNGSLSMVGKILNMTDELTSSLCTAATFRTTPSEQAISIFDNAQLPVKSCKMEPHISNQAMIYSQSQTTPTGSNLPNLYGQKDRRAALSPASVSKRTRYGS